MHLQNRKIKLNVGGTIFTTSESTLMSRPDTYFYAMLSGGHWQPDEDGAYFVDRSPEYFNHILDYLRCGNLNVQGLPQYALEKIRSDLDYFSIPTPDVLRPYLHWDPSACGSNISLCFNNRSASRAPNGEHGPTWPESVLAASPAERFKVRIGAIANPHEPTIRVGFVEKSKFDPYWASGWSILNYQTSTFGFGDGSIVEVAYHSESNRITFTVDGNLIREVEVNNKKEDLYPFVGFWDGGAVTLLDLQ